MKTQHGIAGVVLILFMCVTPAGAQSPDLSTYSPRISTGSYVSLDQEFGVTGLNSSPTILASYTFDAGPTCVDEGWVSIDRTAGDTDFGDYAGMYPALAVVQEDPCRANFTCIWGFFNGSTANYACGGFPSMEAVPRGDAQSGYIHNEIWSPPIALAGTGSWFELRFEVYRDLPLRNLVFYTCGVRSISAGVPGPWRDRDVVYGGGGKDWHTHVEPVGDLIDPGADEIQITLGVVDMCRYWCGTLGDGLCHSHAPLFDNVEVVRNEENGPQWFVHPVDLFQDNFASDGTMTGTVRVDIARDISPRTSADIRPGDSLVVCVGEPTVGLDYDTPGDPSSGPAVYLHVRDASPSKSGEVISGDPARWPLVAAASGWTTLRFDSVRTNSGTVPGRFCVDLDDDLYVPGDTIVFYFSARDAAGRTTYWTEFAGTTPSQANAEFAPCEMTCLPTAPLSSGVYFLYVDDTDGHGAQPYFDTAFHQLGIYDEVDRFDVRGPDYLAGNGLGSRVRDVAGQLGDYRAIMWNSGDLERGLVGDGTGTPEKSPDAHVLAEFLRQEYLFRGLYLSGDDIATELAGLTGAGASELRALINYQLVADSHSRWGFPVSPLVVAEAGSFMDHILGPDMAVVYGGCNIVNDFDVLAPEGDAAQIMRYDGNVGGGDGALLAQQTENALVVLSGFSFHYLRDDQPGIVPDPAEHLRDILAWFLYPPIPPCAPTQLTARVAAEDVRVTWNTPAACLGLEAVRVDRYSEFDSTRVVVWPDSVLTGVGDLVDPIPDVGAWNTYELIGVRYNGVEIKLAEAAVRVPAPTALLQNFPNPFVGSTRIRFALTRAWPVKISVYDVTGRKVATLLNDDRRRPGYAEVEWDGTDDNGNRVASGVYFYRLSTPHATLSRKMVVVR